jgi:hypothetical protein
MAGTEAGPTSIESFKCLAALIKQNAKHFLYHFSRIYQIELKPLCGYLLLATGDWQKNSATIRKSQ